MSRSEVACGCVLLNACQERVETWPVLLSPVATVSLRMSGRVLGGTAIKPVERHGWERVKWCCYDRNTGAVLGRTPAHWCQLLSFYAVYYTCLALFWAAMMYLFFLTVDDQRPKWIGKEGVIGDSPGLGLRPEQGDDYIDSSLILFNRDLQRDEENVPGWGSWAARIKRFLAYYNNKGKVCTPEDPVDMDRACIFRLNNLGACGKPHFGYARGQPCIYLRLNKIFGVRNDPFKVSNRTSVSRNRYYFQDMRKELPNDMPPSLKSHIRQQVDKDQVWVNCVGENPADMESMGPLRYFPASQGLPSYYFPYTNQKHYESPVVAVQFLRPPIGQLLHIECRAWAGNIGYDRKYGIGMVRFELFVLNNATAALYAKNV